MDIWSQLLQLYVGYLYVNEGNCRISFVFCCMPFHLSDQYQNVFQRLHPQNCICMKINTPEKGRGGKESSEKWEREERKWWDWDWVGFGSTSTWKQPLGTLILCPFLLCLRLRDTSGHWWFLFLVCVSHIVNAPLFLILVYMLLSWQQAGIRLGKRP